MPINNPSNVSVTTVYGTLLTIDSEIQTALRALSAGSELLSLNIVRKAVGNNYMAVISYEAAP
jgi:hypothetical protein